jgi:hypothetical protein
MLLPATKGKGENREGRSGPPEVGARYSRSETLCAAARAEGRPGHGCRTRGDGERGKPGTSFGTAGESSTAVADASSSDPPFRARIMVVEPEATTNEVSQAQASPPRARAPPPPLPRTRAPATLPSFSARARYAAGGCESTSSVAAAHARASTPFAPHQFVANTINSP